MFAKQNAEALIRVASRPQTNRFIFHGGGTGDQARFLRETFHARITQKGGKGTSGGRRRATRGSTTTSKRQRDTRRESNPRSRVDQTLFTFDRADRHGVASRFSPPRTSAARKCIGSHLPFYYPPLLKNMNKRREERSPARSTFLNAVYKYSIPS